MSTLANGQIVRYSGIMGIRLLSIGLIGFWIVSSDAPQTHVHPLVLLVVPLISIIGAVLLRVRYGRPCQSGGSASDLTALAVRLRLPRPPMIRWIDSSDARIQAISMGYPWWSTIVIKGDRTIWERQPPEVQLALLHHEAIHLRQGHLFWCSAAVVGTLMILPIGFPSWLLAAALAAGLNRWFELLADRAGAEMASPAAMRRVLDVAGEPPGWSAAAWVPILTLLLTHPPLAVRQAALADS